MHKSATLADLAIAETLKKPVQVVPIEYRQKLHSARKFVLSENMSSYLADITCAPFANLAKHQTGMVQEANKRAMEILDTARRLARAPHAVTWIEYDCVARRRRSREEYGYFVQSSSGQFTEKDEDIVPRVGWLVEQHPNFLSTFKFTEFCEVDDGKGNPGAVVFPYSTMWTTDDDQPLPWKKLPPIKIADKEVPHSVIVSGISAYQSEHVGLCGNAFSKDLTPEEFTGIILESMGEARAMFCFLAMLNDIPVKIEGVRPSKGFIARGNYRRFMEHSIIHLQIPGNRSAKTLAARAFAMLRRRAHEVRGHWRQHWKFPEREACEHAWENLDEQTLACKSCLGRRVWISPHIRGDTSLGFVTHSYSVEKGEHDNGL